MAYVRTSRRNIVDPVPVTLVDGQGRTVFQFFLDASSLQSRLDIITPTAVNQPASLGLWPTSVLRGAELLSDPAGSGLKLDSWKNDGTNVGIRCRTLNAALNAMVDRILITGGADQGNGNIQIQETITKWDVANARTGLHVSADGTIDILKGCNISTWANVTILPTKAGAPTDADFTNPVIGLAVLDTSTPKIWFRTAAATWKGVAIA